MWPILMQFLRSNAPYLTLPFAAMIGVIGYNLEGYFSDRYTPYNINEPRERAFVLITSEGVEQGIIGTVIDQFERKGLKLVGLKLMNSDELQKNYSIKSQFKLDITSGPVIPMVWEGLNSVKSVQMMIGTNAEPGIICGDFCVKVYGSDTAAEANREIALWFTNEEIVKWTSVMEEWIYKL